MTDVDKTIDVAQQLAKDKGEAALVFQLGLRGRAIECGSLDPADAQLQVTYDGNAMGGIDDVKDIGLRILRRWNRELFGVVCSGTSSEDKEIAQKITQSLNLGEAGLIAAVVPALLALNVPAAIAAALAPLIVKKFILPAKDELCSAWGTALQDA
jgi:hypothetical protein